MIILDHPPPNIVSQIFNYEATVSHGESVTYIIRLITHILLVIIVLDLLCVNCFNHWTTTAGCLFNNEYSNHLNTEHLNTGFI